MIHSTPGENRFPLILSLLLLLLLSVLALTLRMEAPPVHLMNEWKHGPAPGGVALGQRELGQNNGHRAAEETHLSFRQDDSGSWWVRNIAKIRKVYIQYRGGGGRDLAWWPLGAGDRFRLDKTEIMVRTSGKAELLLEAPGGRALHWRDGELSLGPGETPSPQCAWRGRQAFKRWLGWVTRDLELSALDLTPRKELRLVKLGGELADPTTPGRFMNCPDSWSLPGVKVGAAAIVWWNHRFWLARNQTGHTLQVKREGEADFKTLDQVETPLKGEDGEVASMVVGRTVYTVKGQPEGLTLRAVANRDVAWTGDPVRDEVWSWMGQGGPDDAPLLSSLTSSLGVQWVHALLSWLIATLILARYGWLRGWGGWLWLMVMVMAGVGVLTVSQLAVGSNNTAWTRDAWKHTLTIASCGWLVAVLAGVEELRRHHAELLTFLIKGGVWLSRGGLVLLGGFLLVAGNPGGAGDATFSSLACLLLLGFTFLPGKPVTLATVGLALYLLLLAAQFMIGKEEGVFGIQPAEGAKFILVLLAAYATSLHHLRMELEPGAIRRHLAMIALLVFLILLIAFLYKDTLDDWSPALLLSFFVLAFLWQVAVPPAEPDAPERARGRRAPISAWRRRFRDHPLGWSLRLFIAAFLVAGALMLPTLQRHPEWMTGLSSSVSIRERLEVWSRPELFSQTGRQLLTGMRRVGEGGWLGVGREVGPAWFGGNGKIMQLAKVQNDFIAAFLLNRFGWGWGVLLLAAQWGYAFMLLMVAERILVWGQTGAVQRYLTGLTLSATLQGLAWMHIGQWLIAWSNPLGLLPVMGQPMTWLAVANSHLLFFAIPSLLLALLVARWGQEAGSGQRRKW